MERRLLAPRAGWQAQMEEVGFRFHSIDGTYWDESRCYAFTTAEVDAIEAATAELHQMALNAAQYVVATDRFDDFAIPPAWRARVKRSWQSQLDGAASEFSLFGRMDLAYDGSGPAKLLEYNADTPTACLEASVAQWHWLEAMRPQFGSAIDQFNSIHEKLVERWAAYRAACRLEKGATLHFAAVEDSEEDWGNVDYLRDCATQAGWRTVPIAVERIGLRGTAFVGEDDEPIERLFKLYPWEWLAREDFSEALLVSPMMLIEPAWKMLLSNKALLVLLWELYPDHPNLLPAYFDEKSVGARYVRKPKLAREGANVLLVDGATRIETGGEYGQDGFVYQALAPVARFGDDTAVLGSWIVGDQPAGLGLREDSSPITRNTSRFVPHFFV